MLRKLISTHTGGGHHGPVSCVAISNNNQFIASASSDGTIRMWSLKQSDPDFDLKFVMIDGTCVDFSPDATLLVSGNQEGLVKVERLNTHEISLLTGHTNPVSQVKVSPDCSKIVGSSLGKIVIWDVQSCNVLQTFEHFKGCGSRSGIASSCLAWSPDSQLVASGAENKLVLSNVATGQTVAELTQESAVSCAVFSNKKGFLAIGCGATIMVLELPEGANPREECRLNGHSGGAVLCIALSPDSTHVVSGDSRETVRVWNIATQQQVCMLQTPVLLEQDEYWPVNSVSWSGKGNLIMSGCEDCAVRVWEIFEQEVCHGLDVCILSCLFMHVGKLYSMMFIAMMYACAMHVSNGHMYVSEDMYVCRTVLTMSLPC
jgi:WD40 repeat protein